MSATARDLNGGPLDETIAHMPDLASGPGLGPEPETRTLLPEATPMGQHRYTFGSGARPLEGYTIKRAIGRGGFGEVYYATSDAGKEVALKLITRHLEVERRGVLQCMNLKSPHLITIYDLKTSEAGDTFVIMEYVAGPSLAQVIRQHPGGLPMAEVRAWLRGLVDGVAYLHDHGIVHRDLKPANLFLEEDTVKIGDYGLTKLISESRGSGHTESIGTCHYMAPEISSGRYHKPIDIYAIGVILFEMLTGRVPFDGESVGEILMKHLTARPDLSGLAEPFRTIVGKALAKDPIHRPDSAYALLPPEEAPRSPDVRFIGQKSNPPVSPTAGPKRDADEDVLRIGAEEPVFYIGPDTRPPDPPRRLAGRSSRQWFWGTAPSAPRARRVSFQQPRRPIPPTPPLPPPPPPLPSGRVRVAELTNSMLWAAPLAALLAFPAGALLGVDAPHDPQQLAFLFGMTLLGTWGALVPDKLWEGREVDGMVRRGAAMGIGLVVGLIGFLLADWTQLLLDPSTVVVNRPSIPGPSRLLESGGRPNLLGFATFFGLLYGLVDWRKLTARDRRAWFRIGAAVWPALIGLLVGMLWPIPRPWGAAIAALVAITTQVASPWSQAAADHARAIRHRAAA